MLKYILKRIFISIFVLLGVSIILYTLVRMMPNDYIDLKYAQQIQDNKITQEQVDYFKELYGIGDKSFNGLVKGYFKWLGNLLQGNLGRSFKYEAPVAEVIGQNMWISFAIAVVATILQFMIAIPLGISSATHQYSVRDYAVTVFTMIGISLPTYFFAAIVIKVFSVELKWFPANGLIYASKDYAATFLDNLKNLEILYSILCYRFLLVLFYH